MKKIRSTVVVLLSLIFFLAEVTVVDFAEANFIPPLPELPTPICIREDGTVEGGSDALQRTGNIYTFVKDINEIIEIQKDNVMIDGNGFTLTKPELNSTIPIVPVGWCPSIRISNRDNVIIKNITFNTCFTGVSIKNSSNVIIIQNIISNGKVGIYMTSSTNCSIVGNKIVDHSGSGLKIDDSSHLKIEYNVISKNHSHGGWIAVSYSNISRNEISYNTASNVGIGLYLYGSNSYNFFFENNFINNDIGLVYQGPSVDNVVLNNYWNNYQEELGNVAKDGNDSDKSPLSNPISISFESSLFPLPSLHTVAEFSSLTLMVAGFFATAILSITYRRRLKGRTK